MRSAVLASTHTPIGRGCRSTVNDTRSHALAPHAVRHAGIDPGDVGVVVMGVALQRSAQGFNAARQAVLQCASGPMAVAPAAKQISGGGGQESVPLVQTNTANDPKLAANFPGLYMALIRGKRRGIRDAAVTICVGVGIGASDPIEVA